MIKNITNEQRLNLTLENASSLPSELLESILKTDGSIDSVRTSLNSHYKPEYCVLANAMLNDAAMETSQDGRLYDVAETSFRFALLHDLNQWHAEINSAMLKATGRLINFPSNQTTNIHTGQSAVKAIEMAIHLYNLAKLTNWAYFGISNKLDTYIHSIDLIEPHYPKAANAIDKEGEINLLSRQAVGESITVKKDSDGSYILTMSEVLSKMLALHTSVQCRVG